MLLYGSETRPMSPDLSHIKTNDHAMIQWICSVKIKQQHSTESLEEDLISSIWTKKIINFVTNGPTSHGK